MHRLVLLRKCIHVVLSRQKEFEDRSTFKFAGFADTQQDQLFANIEASVLTGPLTSQGLTGIDNEALAVRLMVPRGPPRG